MRASHRFRKIIRRAFNSQQLLNWLAAPICVKHGLAQYGMVCFCVSELLRHCSFFFPEVGVLRKPRSSDSKNLILACDLIEVP